MPYGINNDPDYIALLRQAEQAQRDALQAWLTGISVRMEGFVRPFVSVESFRTPRVPPTPTPVEPEAFIRWGGPSTFSFDDTFRDVAGGGFSTHTDDDDDEEQIDEYTETGRSTSDVKVENPDDPDQFVIVAKINSMSLNGPGGRKIKFSFSG